ncbi:MAG: electron transfer flavoprotein subunit alpha/FixB family protein [Chloroflexota bacterium]|nr:MAG: electron transfer flavoprotein subunit alpha/FixB family protein [Chloroflexota bacterium]
MTKILAFSEESGGLYELLGKAAELCQGDRVAALLLSDGVPGAVDECFFNGADIVYRVSAEGVADESDLAGTLARLADTVGVDIYLISSTKRGKEIAARLATRLGAGCVTDVIDLRREGDVLLADRYTLGGNSVATEEVLTARKVYAVMPYAFGRPERDASRTGQTVDVELAAGGKKKRLLERKPKAREGVRLEEAERIIAVGKGLINQDDLRMVSDLADAIGAEIACTRPLGMDLHWLSEDRIVGLTGVKAAPKLYLAVGVSGQIQHTVGITRAKTIVAINKAADAPIFKVSDYGIVGDLYAILPELLAQVKKGG